MTVVTPLHSPFSEPSYKVDETIDGGILGNCGAVIELLKRGESPKARRAYRLFLAEFRAINSSALSQDQREFHALQAAFRQIGLTLIDPTVA